MDAEKDSSIFGSRILFGSGTKHNLHGKAPGLASETLTLTVKGGITGPGPQPVGSRWDVRLEIISNK